jgi:hypothetical protein
MPNPLQAGYYDEQCVSTHFAFQTLNSSGGMATAE